MINDLVKMMLLLFVGLLGYGVLGFSIIVIIYGIMDKISTPTKVNESSFWFTWIGLLVISIGAIVIYHYFRGIKRR